MYSPLHSTFTSLALVLGAASAFAQGYGPANPGHTVPTGVYGQHQQVGDRSQGRTTGRGGIGAQTRALLAGAGFAQPGVPQDAFAGTWQGDARWQLPDGPLLNFPVTVEVTRDARGYRVQYTGEVPGQGQLQPSQTRWSASFTAGLQRDPASGQPVLMGQTLDYAALIVDSNQRQGPWSASIGLSPRNGRLAGQIGNPDFGFAQFDLARPGAVQPGPTGTAGLPFQLGQQGIPSQQGTPERTPAAPTSIVGTWNGTVHDTDELGAPLTFPVRIQVTDQGNGRFSASFRADISMNDPSTGQTYRFVVEETFRGSGTSARVSLNCANVRLKEVTSGQLVDQFAATLHLQAGPQGLTGSVGDSIDGFSEIRFAPATGAPQPGTDVPQQGGYGPPQGGYGPPQGGHVPEEGGGEWMTIEEYYGHDPRAGGGR